MAKHRLLGDWASPTSPAVFITVLGDVVRSNGGTIGSVNRKVDVGEVWSFDGGPFADWELELMALDN